MATITELKALQEAQSDINDSALSDFATTNPDFVPGAIFDDVNPLRYQIVLLYATNGGVVILAQWLRDDLSPSSAYKLFFTPTGLTIIPS